MNAAQRGRAGGPVLVAFGTRPEVIKLAPVVQALAARQVPRFVLSTGQHRQMLDQMLGVFGLEPDEDLALMQPDQSLAGLSSAMIAAADPLLARVAPSLVVVQGDTTTVAMIALAAFYRQIPVAHVEAGLRTGVRYDPFPEEMNRSLLGRLAEWHFAPTPRAAENLFAEGISRERIFVVGNTVVDALEEVRRRVAPEPWGAFGLPDPGDRALILVTAHRRENLGGGLERLAEGLRRIALAHAGRVQVVYPVHLNPNVRSAVLPPLADLPGVTLLEPLGYPAFVKALSAARLVITDSGGVQEEATALGVPLLVTRETSERPEAIEAGVAELVGTDPERIAAAAGRLLTDAGHHASRARAAAVFGDGRAGARIVEHLLEALAGP
ncbi:MAG TPA: UDP-N-acetylglucosamine 2-epimerase (non-hydrolyzing) [Thermoanaerobaculia bacterium]|nr:UDP-N-acetylglucosamine 2-epimerase (non-hydrolyzing) [Thermoanaerobaculia bacterium]